MRAAARQPARSRQAEQAEPAEQSEQAGQAEPTEQSQQAVQTDQPDVVDWQLQLPALQAPQAVEGTQVLTTKQDRDFSRIPMGLNGMDLNAKLNRFVQECIAYRARNPKFTEVMALGVLAQLFDAPAGGQSTLQQLLIMPRPQEPKYNYMSMLEAAKDLARKREQEHVKRYVNPYLAACKQAQQEAVDAVYPAYRETPEQLRQLAMLQGVTAPGQADTRPYAVVVADMEQLAALEAVISGAASARGA